MPDERQDSIRQGIQAPEESPIGQAAAEERRQRAADAPPMDGAMGGTSDADRAGDEAQSNAAQHRALDDDPTSTGAGTGTGQPSEQTIRESREASLRAEGGGSADEDDIRRAAQKR